MTSDRVEHGDERVLQRFVRVSRRNERDRDRVEGELIRAIL